MRCVTRIFIIETSNKKIGSVYEDNWLQQFLHYI